ncbi:hypothetical protein ABES03_14185 [Neobacillus rhizosphaerae]|uniref:hypothetical protein n=1 Tax=Neobacillus rhizosphaerae TaxID=2880965 RepID=UPI003D28025E
MDKNIKYLPISTGIRPAKVVVLVNINSEFWETDCLALLAMFNRIWGGDYNLIIPTDGVIIDPSFLKIMKEYDPDYIYYYVSSLHQLKVFDSNNYEKVIEKFIRENSSSSRNLDKEDIETQPSFLGMELTSFEISKQLIDTLKKNLNYFNAEGSKQLLPFKYSEKISYPLTDMSTILEYSGLDDVKALKVRTSSSISKLLLHSKFGFVDSYLEENILEKDISLKYEEVNNELDFYRLFDLIYERDKPLDKRSYGFKVPSVNLEYYISTDTDLEESNPITVIGNTLSDFCLYYSLSKIKNKVFWMPINVEFDDELHNIINFKRQSMIYEDSNAIVFVSTSLTEDCIKEIIGEMETKRQFHSEMIPYIITNKIETLLNNIIFVYGKDNHMNEQVLIFDTYTNQSIYPIDTPVPLYFSKVSPSGHYWITDIRVKNTIFPKNQYLASELLSATHYGSRNIRITNKGISYFSPNFVYFNSMGDNIKSIKVNPYLKYPDTLKLFKKLFQKAGYSIKYSDKGNFEEVFINKFKDLGNVADILLTDAYRKVFDKFIDTSSNKAGVYTNGIVLNKRRYLDYETIHTLLNDTELVSKIFNNLLENDVIERGFIFKCQSCRNADWYNISLVDNTFKCPRCYKVQNYTTDTLQLQPINHRVQPIWYYKLNEMVYQAYLHNSLVPILTLAKLKKSANTSFSYIPEIEIRVDEKSSKPHMEIDICCVVDGDIVIGECKKGNNLKDSGPEEDVIQKYLKLADSIQAHVVVFSTLGKWSHTTLELLRKYQSITKNPKIVILNGEDLISE